MNDSLSRDSEMPPWWYVDLIPSLVVLEVLTSQYPALRVRTSLCQYIVPTPVQ